MCRAIAAVIQYHAHLHPACFCMHPDHPGPHGGGRGGEGGCRSICALLLMRHGEWLIVVILGGIAEVERPWMHMQPFEGGLQ